MSVADDELQAALRGLVARVDPVPEGVREAGRAAFGWRRLDAELAELLDDSAVAGEALALTRGPEAAVRSVTFGTGRRTVDLDIVEDAGMRRLRGQLSPAAPAVVEVQRSDGEIVASAPSDELGRFRVTVAGEMTIRLRIVPPGGLEPLETAWIGV
jgi:hypothetical protein